MFDVQREELIWGDRKLVLETGKTARQADGAVVATYGETTVLATVVAAKEPKPGIDFMPLTVNYQERAYAAGRIPGGYFKREGRPSEKETLVSRLIDRPIRPLFVEGWRNDTQVVVTVLSHDLENDPDIVSMVAASAALTLSGVPFTGPIGAARVGFVNGSYKLNPLVTEIAESTLDLVVAGTQDAVLMVESEAKELSEEVMLGAVMFGHKHFQPVIEAIIRLAEKAAKEPRDFSPPENSDVEKAVLEIGETELREAYKKTVKQERYAAVDAVKAKVVAALCPAEGEQKFSPEKVKAAFKEAQSKVVRWNILDTGSRIDGRDVKTVRPIVSEVGVLPRAHGSAMFTRGETQALVVATLGTGEDEQFIDALEGTYKERFLLHYNFPPYSVGETGRMGSPGRREIGHGNLAERALVPVLPDQSEFPYTIRCVSEVLSSNGSTSQASICGSTLALMDAGVPIKAPVAGISCGLITDGDPLHGGRWMTMLDIQGVEDFHGDMDFKVGGTRRGITAIQMDIKVDGLTYEIVEDALEKCRKGRLYILDEIIKPCIAAPRAELSKYAPKMFSMVIPVDKIKDVIGKGGKVIQEICANCNCKIDIEEDGHVFISAIDAEDAKRAIGTIKTIVEDPEIGAIYKGRVTRLMNFGAFVEIAPGKEGLVHISKLDDHRVERVEDVVAVGDPIFVMVTDIDQQGRINLSRKDALAAIAKKRAAQQ